MNAREEKIYNDYMMSGNQNFYSDRARAEEIARTGHILSIDDRFYGGDHDARNSYQEDIRIYEMFYGRG